MTNGDGTAGTLVCDGLVKGYGGVEVLHRIDLDWRAGSVLGLIGENGAGKSSLSGIIAGSHLADAGTMTLDGLAYEPHTPADALRLGVGIIHQEIRTVTELSVAENIFLGRIPIRRGRVDWKRMYNDSADALAALGVKIDPRRQTGGLSMAQQQEIEIAKAISRNLRFIIFDEPTASVGPAEVEQILERIRYLRDQGVGVIYISHHLSEARDICDQIVCLRDGTLVERWATGAVLEDELVRAMVGRAVVYSGQAPAAPDPEVVLEVEGLACKDRFDEVSFTLHAGEILGVAGLVGAGRTELVRALAGADRPDSGTVRVMGSPVDLRTTRSAIDRGIVMVPEDRKTQGLDLGQSGYRNIALPWERSAVHKGIVRERTIRKLAERATEHLKVDARLDMPVGRLSGGNQQKVLLSKWLAERPKVLILDEPTRGVDVGAKASIHEGIRNMASEGIVVIVVSSELEEVLALSHRVLVMCEGHCQGILKRADATPERVMSMAVRAA